MSTETGRPATGIEDYAEAAAAFRREHLERLFDGNFATGINVCVECCDRHVASGGVALAWESHDGRSASYTFAEMKELSARVANLLVERGVKPGDAVAGMLPRTPELLATILGTWRAGAVYQPLFTAFGPKAIEHRLKMSGAKLVVTDLANRAKLADIADCPPVAVVTRPGDSVPLGDIDFRAEIAAKSAAFEPVLRKGTDLFLMMSTSGTTGLPKGVPVPLDALPAFYAYMRDAVDLRPDDIFWNIADPGWAYGLYYAVTGPLLLGHATTFYEGPFNAESTYGVIKRRGITNLAGAPTAYRLLIAAGPAPAAPVKGQLRAVSSAGEPLNPEVIRWFREHLDAPIYDHYGQTELGMVVNNHHRLRHPVHPGSAGLAMPGYRVAVLDEHSRELPPNVPGVLAVDIARSPLLWFGGYWQQETPAIAGGYYRTGDTVELEPDGSISFVGRADDVITSSGYRIGPFDVESALIEHPTVIEAAVIGKPDPERTEIVKAYVVLTADVEPTEHLAEELRQYVKTRLSAHAYPREIEFVEQLPKTPSGKLQRFVLRKREVEQAKEAATHAGDSAA
ncbi:acyl-CoA synthetase [Blastochloris viridis]|uniref:Acetyl-coenzyme A synthetase n=1 Tax=Blastochloris viridis TaxID=1079 RepID=A0A0H5B8M3_BLAVI|nr:acyl-CoA synthetase [Blastochloris viridis]ALK08172.1 Acetyl-coenzyme A synthetase [Blastochloris viridis]BAR98562.1 acetyl-coenzyme A synthetase [Blastochloris viridis]CUU44094.1 Acetyl-coenzyme A synthetase [Blastochloris viridis]